MTSAIACPSQSSLASDLTTAFSRTASPQLNLVLVSSCDRSSYLLLAFHDHGDHDQLYPSFLISQTTLSPVLPKLLSPFSSLYALCSWPSALKPQASVMPLPASQPSGLNSRPVHPSDCKYSFKIPWRSSLNKACSWLHVYSSHRRLLF